MLLLLVLRLLLLLVKGTMSRHARHNVRIRIVVVGWTLVNVETLFEIVNVFFCHDCAVWVGFVSAAVLGKVVGSRKGLVAERADVWSLLCMCPDMPVMMS